jgi:hypothetical protein
MSKTYNFGCEVRMEVNIERERGGEGERKRAMQL